MTKLFLPGDVVAGVEVAAYRGFGAEDGEKFGGHRRPAESNRIAAAGQIEFVSFGVCGEIHRFRAFAQSDQRAFWIGAVMLTSCSGCA